MQNVKQPETLDELYTRGTTMAEVKPWHRGIPMKEWRKMNALAQATIQAEAWRNAGSIWPCTPEELKWGLRWERRKPT